METFIDPARFAGTCYRAAGWTPLGLTRGYARREAGYVAHGQPKLIFVRPLHPDARHRLQAPWPPPRPASVGDRMQTFDVNGLPLNGAGGLMEALATVPDPRHRRGVRHPVRGLLVVAVAAVLAGARHLLSAILPGLGVVVAQHAVAAKTNEIPCAAPLLASLPLAGAVVTADAIHTQAATARAIVGDHHADYVFTVKDNQPTLKEDIATLGLEGVPPSALRRDQGARPD